MGPARLWEIKLCAHVNKNAPTSIVSGEEAWSFVVQYCTETNWRLPPFVKHWGGWGQKYYLWPPPRKLKHVSNCLSYIRIQTKTQFGMKDK
jgi:phage-related protein